jgi:hypothetical protein
LLASRPGCAGSAKATAGDLFRRDRAAAAHRLRSQIYAFAALGTFVSCTLEVLMPDQATYQAVGTSTTLSAAGFVSGLYLPGGTFKIVIA